ncbi:unnamed protein product, partial [marine sediment metagenome]
ENILIADSETDFAQFVLMCFRDANLRTKLTTNAIKLVRSEYSWEQIGRKLNAYLDAFVINYEYPPSPRI